MNSKSNSTDDRDYGYGFSDSSDHSDYDFRDSGDSSDFSDHGDDGDSSDQSGDCFRDSSDHVYHSDHDYDFRDSSDSSDHGAEGTGQSALDVDASSIIGYARGYVHSDADPQLVESESNVLSDSLSGPQLRAAIEAILLVVDLPITESELAHVLQCSAVQVHKILIRWQQELQQEITGISLRYYDGGWRLYTHSDYAEYIERLLGKGIRTKLSRAALETLAIIAYKQPVSRSEISAIRGVNVDAMIRTLQARGLIIPVMQEESGPTRYATTTEFLTKLGITDLAQLPPLSPLLPEVEKIDEIIAEIADD